MLSAIMSATRNLYRRISAKDLFCFLSAVVYNLLSTVPLLVLLETAVILLLYLCFVFPLDLLRSEWEQRKIFSERLRLNLIQDAANRFVRLAFAYFDYRIGRKCCLSLCSLRSSFRYTGSFFSHEASLALVKSRLGQSFSESCRRIQVSGKGKNVDGWWIADAADLPLLCDGSASSKKIYTVMFIHGSSRSRHSQ